MNRTEKFNEFIKEMICESQKTKVLYKNGVVSYIPTQRFLELEDTLINNASKKIIKYVYDLDLMGSNKEKYIAKVCEAQLQEYC